ncbi:MAG TPA: class I SAM-dependent methyltransferase [Verrucomicrobiae bacterium]|nr:class I SAM-dependent methyltransferase [Verrucomicrobiae bacterium]
MTPQRFAEAQRAEAVHHREAWTHLHVGPLPHVQSIVDYRYWLESYYRTVLMFFGFGVEWFQGRSVIEIGSGPFGAVACLPPGDRVAVDPLMDEFAEYMRPQWTDGVVRLTARGECLPLPDERFDAAIMINCLDHTDRPDKVLRELARVTRRGGKLFFMNNVKSRVGCLMAKLGEALRIRKLMEVYHPHAFTSASAIRLMASAGWRLQGSAWSRARLESEHRKLSWKGRLRLLLNGESAFYGLFERT